MDIKEENDKKRKAKWAAIGNGSTNQSVLTGDQKVTSNMIYIGNIS